MLGNGTRSRAQAKRVTLSAAILDLGAWSETCFNQEERKRDSDDEFMVDFVDGIHVSVPRVSG
jgi:hypothetical protein